MYPGKPLSLGTAYHMRVKGWGRRLLFFLIEHIKFQLILEKKNMFEQAKKPVATESCTAKLPVIGIY